MNTNTFQRRYELDWLRVIAILTVFLYHCSLIFAPDAYSIKNGTIYEFLDDWGNMAGMWGIPLIFLISGASAFHALGKVGPAKYVKGLVLRLLVPLLVGMFTHASLQVYLENLNRGTFTGSFFAFYPHYFEGLYGFGGNFAWMGMHLWYLEALFLYSLLCLPLFVWLKKSAGGQRILAGLGNLLAKPGAVYLFALPLVALVSILDPDSWGTTVLGGWSPLVYPCFFIAGFVIISSQALQVSIKRWRWLWLLAAIISWGLVDVVWQALGEPGFGTWQFSAGFGMYILSAWSWLLAILGFGFTHLNRNNPFLKYANQAVLPFYILHQTVILALAFFIVQWALPDGLKFVLITACSFLGSLGIYEFLVRRNNLLRILFGMKVEQKAGAPSLGTKVIEPATL